LGRLRWLVLGGRCRSCRRPFARVGVGSAYALTGNLGNSGPVLAPGIGCCAGEKPSASAREPYRRRRHHRLLRVLHPPTPADASEPDDGDHEIAYISVPATLIVSGHVLPRSTTGMGVRPSQVIRSNCVVRQAGQSHPPGATRTLLRPQRYPRPRLDQLGRLSLWAFGMAP
jgi:hypothetical protein